MRVLLTGGSRGIGAEIRKQIERRGITVVAPTRAEMELSSEKSIRAFCASLNAPIDVLINCGGILADESNVNGFNEVMAVNALAPWLLTQALAPVLSQAHGRVVNVSSIYGLTSKFDAERPQYSASKAALNSFTRTAAIAFSGKISVNAMCPGWCKTRLGGPHAPRSAVEGASIVVWLALDCAPETTGIFFIAPHAPVPW